MPENDPIRIATVVTPFDDLQLQRVAQVGCTEVAVRHPAYTGRSLADMQQHAARHGLRVGSVEGGIPHNQIVHDGPGRDEQIQQFRDLLHEMGRLGIPVCCFNFMPNDDWCRTSVDIAERGGALVTAFNLEQVGSDTRPLLEGATRASKPVTRDQLWDRLVNMLREIAPAAREAGVKLALHPDDPPVPSLMGHEHLLYEPEVFARLFEAVPDEASGLCFCQGTFATMGVDIPRAIERFGSRIHYVHFRDVEGRPENFRETFHDNGPTDMAAAIRAYRAIGYEGMMRPDHVPTLAGEPNDSPGYAMLGRLFAIGYIRGLLDATR